jgi:hypothetical protein
VDMKYTTYDANNRPLNNIAAGYDIATTRKS